MPIPIECERRFLVTGDEWKGMARRSHRIRQGYLTTNDKVTVRVRLLGERGYLTIKSAQRGFTRNELEYEIPADHAEFLLNTACGRMMVEKVRHEVPHDGQAWEVDEFAGLNDGLVLAEIELDRADRPLALPAWVGREVTAMDHFHNSYLCRHPYTRWSVEAPYYSKTG